MARALLFLAAMLAAPAVYGQTGPIPALPDRGSRTVSVSTEPELQQAVRALASNTTIVIQPGTYRLTATLYVRGPLDNVAIRGATADRDAVVIAGGGMRNPAGGADAPYGIWSGGQVSRLTIADLTIRDFSEHGIILNPSTMRPLIHNVRLLDIGAQFIKGNPDAMGRGVDDGVLEYSAIEYTTTSRDFYTNGIDIHGGARWAVRRNVFRNITAPPGELAGPAVLFWNRSADTVTEGNVFINCARGIAYGLLDRDGTDHRGGVIRNNIIFRAPGQAGDVGIHVADSPDTQVVNNTVFLSGTYPSPIEFRYASSTGLMIVNNLLDGRIFARDGASAALRANITDATAALFVDAANGDLHLTASAARAIDRGETVAGLVDDVDGQPRPAGAAQDVGADEFESGVTPR